MVALAVRNTMEVANFCAVMVTLIDEDGDHGDHLCYRIAWVIVVIISLLQDCMGDRGDHISVTGLHG